MKQALSYEEAAETLAQYVYDFYCKDESFANGSAMKVFDHEFTSNREIIADVLTKLRIIAPIDEHGRHSTFVCSPSEFGSTALAHGSVECDYELLIVAIIALVPYGVPRDRKLLDALIQLGICKPVEFKIKEVELSQNVKIPRADFEIIWTKERARYDERRRLWRDINA